MVCVRGGILLYVEMYPITEIRSTLSDRSQAIINFRAKVLGKNRPYHEQ